LDGTEKSFILPEDAKQRYFTILFDGAMSNSVVWLNGHQLGTRPYGYSSFYFDLAPYLHFGREANVLSVRLSPEDHSSRWYPGAGTLRRNSSSTGGAGDDWICDEEREQPLSTRTASAISA
jgi:hypothetical protein